MDDGWILNSPLEALYNSEAEQIVVARVLLCPKDWARLGYLKPEDFGYVGHARIWRELGAMVRDGTDISPVTVAHRLAQEQAIASAGGSRYVTDLACNAIGILASEAAAELVRDLSLRRQLRDRTHQALEELGGQDVSAHEMLGGIIRDLEAMMAHGPRKGRSKREVAEALVTGLAEPVPCYSTGLAGLDKILGGGLFTGKLYGFAARKKVGKTALLGTISHNLNAAGVRHLFIAMESGSAQIEQRNAARHGGFNAIRFLKRDDMLLAERVANYAVTVPNETIYQDMPGASLDQIRAAVAQHIAVDDIQGVILDYWQLVGGKAAKETEEFHLRNVAQWMADTAVREHVFFCAAAQVNQQGNTRGGEGLKLACDWYGTLHREKDEKGAWVEMDESRYTIYENLGSPEIPGLWLNSHGPFFRGADE